MLLLHEAHERLGCHEAESNAAACLVGEPAVRQMADGWTERMLASHEENNKQRNK
jgi:hypothetical protein